MFRLTTSAFSKFETRKTGSDEYPEGLIVRVTLWCGARLMEQLLVANFTALKRKLFDNGLCREYRDAYSYDNTRRFHALRVIRNTTSRNEDAVSSR